MFCPFFFFFLMYVMSFIVVMGVSDWVLVWLGLEMNMVSFLAMMYDRWNILSIEACMKYYFMQAIASALFVVIVYVLHMNVKFMCFMMMMMKVGGGPYYYWLVSVFLGLNWFSGWMVVVLQKILPLWVSSSFLGEYVYLFALISLLVGAVGVVNQLIVKRLMIYSSLHHLGWMMVSMMVSWELWVMYMGLYSVIVGMVFYFMSNMHTICASSWLGSSKQWVLVISLFNMGGIPPMLGFFLKVYVLFSLWGSDKMIFLVLVGVSVLILYVYLRLVFDLLVGGVMDLGFLGELGLEEGWSLMMVSLLGCGFGVGLMWSM